MMQYEDDIYIQNVKKAELLKAVGGVINSQRISIHKGINTFSYEYDIGNGLLCRLEKGLADTKLTTLWKLANAFGYKCSDFIKLIEEKLPTNFNFYD
ncbi:MAG: hypothetical protein ACI37Q_03215 [Candidatus Gastranaerophilaceae bacterium]